jgi:hypothetical protein
MVSSCWERLGSEAKAEEQAAIDKRQPKLTASADLNKWNLP